MLDQNEYVVGTFEPIDVEYSLDGTYDELLEYIMNNDLMDSIVLSTVKMLRDWYDCAYSDPAFDFMVEAMKRHVGEEKMEELGWC